LSVFSTLNKETGKTDFMFPKDYKEALAAGKVIPDDRHKAQVAVNSEGKTHEATKDVKEPLKQGQTKPTEKQAEKQKAENDEKPKQKRGRKIS
jgi:predicted metalloprotease